MTLTHFETIEANGPAPAALWDDALWEPLIKSIRRGKVVPIIGPELALGTSDAGPVTIDSYVAKELAMSLKLDVSSLPDVRVNDVVRLAKNRNIYEDLIYSKISRILDEAPLKPAAVLEKLARITDFKLYVTLSYDTLLEGAIEEERGIKLDRNANAYFPPDAPSCDLAWVEEPVVYYLLGRHQAMPEFAVTDSDLIEFMLGLHSANAPQRLLEHLRGSYLLFLGGAFPDWLLRFLLRSIKQKPLVRSSDFDRTIDILADSLSYRDSNFVGFLSAFNSKTRVFNADAETFVDQLWVRWSEAMTKAGVAPVARRQGAGDADSQVFISYASQDLVAAQRIAARLEASGLSVWLDRRHLQGGSRIDSAIEAAIDRCRLFVPLISRTTEERLENAYFRSEWKRATRRADRNAADVTYIYPVIIDGSRLADLHSVQGWKNEILFREAPGGNLAGRDVAEIKDLCEKRKGP